MEKEGRTVERGRDIPPEPSFSCISTGKYFYSSSLRGLLQTEITARSIFFHKRALPIFRNRNTITCYVILAKVPIPGTFGVRVRLGICLGTHLLMCFFFFWKKKYLGTEEYGMRTARCGTGTPLIKTTSFFYVGGVCVCVFSPSFLLNKNPGSIPWSHFHRPHPTPLLFPHKFSPTTTQLLSTSPLPTTQQQQQRAAHISSCGDQNTAVAAVSTQQKQQQVRRHNTVAVDSLV